MLGRKVGVHAKLKQLFPNIIGWHCLNHRLELSVHDVVQSLTGINHLKSFVDNLYSLYSRSPKAKRELDECAADVGTQVYKIGRILDVRWSASSYRTVKAVWRSYAGLHGYFLQSSVDMSLDSKERAKFTGLAKKLTSVVFVKNFALMLDALEELRDLFLDLQKGDVTFVKADRLIARQIEVFSSRKDKPGVYYTDATHAITAVKFCGIQLTASNKEIEINCKQVYQALVDSMTARLISETDKKFRDVESFIEKEQYQGVFAADHGEVQLRALCTMFNFPFSDMKQAFRDYKDSKGDNITKMFQKLLNAVDTVPVSTAACERGFSQMNEICTSLRSQITVAHI